jgi:N-acetylglucosaminyl-diphospho-decaprenol L-rhamnosyltransferase
MSTAPSPLITVSVVSHAQWGLVQPLLHQLDLYCREAIDSVVLTLNLPEQVTPDPAWRMPVRIVRNARPAGFGANHNAAFAVSRTPWFLVLNPDIRIDRDVLSVLLGRARKDAGLVAPRVQEPGRAEPEPYRGVVTPLELWRRRLVQHRPPPSPAWVPGMFMLLRREAYAQLGGFDERYFMYCEDFDLCARLRLAGWQLQVEEVMVMHQARRASNSSLQPLLWHLVSFARLWTSSAFWRAEVFAR